MFPILKSLYAHRFFCLNFYLFLLCKIYAILAADRKSVSLVLLFTIYFIVFVVHIIVFYA